MIINFSNLGSGSGGGTTGSVDTNAIQRYLTAATDSAFTGLTDLKEGDIACLVSHDVVIPNSYEYEEGWDVSFYDGEWWKDRAGYDVQLSFDAAQVISQDVLYFIQQHNIELETDDKLELIISLLDESNNWLCGLGIAVDSAGTVYEMSQETGDWEELTGSTQYTTMHVPSNVNSVEVNTNNYDFNLSEPDAIYSFRETGSNIMYYHQNGEWVRLEKVYPTYKYVNDKFGEVGNSIWNINNTLSGYNARITNNTTNISNLSGKSQTRLGIVTTLPTGGSEGDVAILQQVDTGSSSVSAISFNDFVSMAESSGITPGMSFTFSADTSVTNRLEIGVMYNVSGVSHFFQIGCNSTGQWYNILGATNQTETSWDGSVITFTFPSDATNIRKYLQGGYTSNLYPLYIETDVYETVQVPYTKMAGQWEHPVVSNDIYRVVSMSQADYDALSGNTDSHTLYNITGTTS